jgi:release factor glutamine methyltransferase
MFDTLSSLQHAANNLGINALDADRLLLSVLRRSASERTWLRVHGSEAVSANTTTRYLALCQRRLDGVPLAYLTGERGFYGLTLHIDSRVLDPRPDTETLVDWALDLLQSQPAPRVADLGTGSGAVALAIQHQRPDAMVWAVDTSAQALEVAESNAARLGLAVQFSQGNWLSPPPAQLQHLIVSNPPYIPEDDPHMAALRHEPRQALTSGPDGLHDIRFIIAQAPACLRNGAWLLLEHGYDQASAVQALFTQRGFVHVQSRKDLGGHVRCTGGQWVLPAGGDNVCLSG